MKITNKKLFHLALPAALLTLAALVPADMGAFSFSLVALQNMTSNYFVNTTNYFSNLYSRFSSQATGGIKQFSTGPIFLKKPLVGTEKSEKKVDPTMFKLEPKKNIGKYQKAGNTEEKEVTKQFLWEGNFAPDKIAPKINTALDQMRKNGTARANLTFNHGALELIIRIVREETLNSFRIYMNISEILEKPKPVGERCFPIKFEQITEKNGTSYERVTMTPGEFSVKLEYRQNGIGHYLFSVQNAFLKLQKNALGIIYPFPYGLTGDDKWEDLLPILRKYYESFGFIPHPTWVDHMLIFFKNGKLDPAMDLLRAIYKFDMATIEKLLDNGLSLDTILNDTTVVEAALYHIFSQNHKHSPEIIKILAKHGALKDPKNLSRALNYALFNNKTELLITLTANGALKDPKYISFTLDYALWENKKELLNTLSQGSQKSIILCFGIRDGQNKIIFHIHKNDCEK